MSEFTSRERKLDGTGQVGKIPGKRHGVEPKTPVPSKNLEWKQVIKVGSQSFLWSKYRKLMSPLLIW